MSPGSLASLRRQFRSWQEITGKLQDVRDTGNQEYREIEKKEAKR